MEKRMGKWVVAGTAVIIFVGVPAFAEESAPAAEVQDDRGQGMDLKGKFAKELGLSEEQSEKLRAHREQNKGKMKSLYEQMKAKRQELRAEIQSADPDVSKMKALAAEIKTVFGQIMDLRIEGVIFMRETLTPEQYQKFQEKIKERRSSHGWGKGENGERGKWREKMRQRQGEGAPSGPPDESGKADEPDGLGLGF